MQTLLDGSLHRRAFVYALGGLALTLALCALVTDRPLAFGQAVSLLGGWPLALAVAALVGAAIVFLDPRRAASIVVVIVAVELVLLTPHGILYPRSTPYPKRNWISALVAETSVDRSRVFSSDAFLFPETATVYGLQDPRLLDALYVDRYWRYLKTFIAAPPRRPFHRHRLECGRTDR